MRSAARLLGVGLLLALPLRVAAEDARGVVMLRSSDHPPEEQVLHDLVRIAIRDLGRAAITVDGPAAEDGSTIIERVSAIARRHRAEIVVWVEWRSTGASLFALHVERQDLRSTEADSIGLSEAGQALALRMRAMLTTTSTAKDPSPPAVILAPPRAIAAPPITASSTRSGRIVLSASYLLLVPADPLWLRHGAVISVGARLGRLPLVLALDGGVAWRPDAEVQGYRIGLRDIPLGIALKWRGERGRWIGGVGPRVSGHILDVDAASSERSGAGRRYALGIGAIGEIALRIAPHLGLYASVNVEGIAPRQRFLAAGSQVLDGGWAVLGTQLGLIVWAL